MTPGTTRNVEKIGTSDRKTRNVAFQVIHPNMIAIAASRKAKARRDETWTWARISRYDRYKGTIPVRPYPPT